MNRPSKTKKQHFDDVLNEIFLTVLKNKKIVTPDDVYRLAREQLIHPVEITSRLAPLTKRYTAAGYMKKLRTYIVSERNPSKILPEYESTLFNEPGKGSEEGLDLTKIEVEPVS